MTQVDKNIDEDEIVHQPKDSLQTFIDKMIRQVVNL